MKPALVAALTLGCVACTDTYLARRDSITMSTGDAVARNAAIHTRDPWPRVAERTDDVISGARLQRAIERYRNPAPTSGAGVFGGVVPAEVPPLSTAPVAR